ncbi:MAG TPA: VOC family protein [Pantanalinema sp.]
MSTHYLHTKLRVHDLEAGIRFYQEAFGYELRKRKPGPEGSEIAFVSLPGDQTELQLAYYPDGDAFEVPALMLHIALKVSDVEAAVASAVKAGATLRSGPYALPSGSRVAFVRDLDGYDLELIQKSE